MAKRYVIINADDKEILAFENSGSFLSHLNSNDAVYAGTIETTDEDEAKLLESFGKSDCFGYVMNWDRYAPDLGFEVINEGVTHSEDAAMTPAEHLADKGV